MYKDVLCSIASNGNGNGNGDKNWPEGESINSLRGQSNVSAATYRWGALICTDMEIY